MSQYPAIPSHASARTITQGNEVVVATNRRVTKKYTVSGQAVASERILGNPNVESTHTRNTIMTESFYPGEPVTARSTIQSNPSSVQFVDVPRPKVTNQNFMSPQINMAKMIVPSQNTPTMIRADNTPIETFSKSERKDAEVYNNKYQYNVVIKRHEVGSGATIATPRSNQTSLSQRNVVTEYNSPASYFSQRYVALPGGPTQYATQPANRIEAQHARVTQEFYRPSNNTSVYNSEKELVVEVAGRPKSIHRFEPQNVQQTVESRFYNTLPANYSGRPQKSVEQVAGRGVGQAYGPPEIKNDFVPPFQGKFVVSQTEPSQGGAGQIFPRAEKLEISELVLSNPPVAQGPSTAFVQQNQYFSQRGIQVGAQQPYVQQGGDRLAEAQAAFEARLQAQRHRKSEEEARAQADIARVLALASQQAKAHSHQPALHALAQAQAQAQSFAQNFAAQNNANVQIQANRQSEEEALLKQQAEQWYKAEAQARYQAELQARQSADSGKFRKQSEGQTQVAAQHPQQQVYPGIPFQSQQQPAAVGSTKVIQPIYNLNVPSRTSHSEDNQSQHRIYQKQEGQAQQQGLTIGSRPGSRGEVLRNQHQMHDSPVPQIGQETHQEHHEYHIQENTQQLNNYQGQIERKIDYQEGYTNNYGQSQKGLGQQRYSNGAAEHVLSHQAQGGNAGLIDGHRFTNESNQSGPFSENMEGARGRLLSGGFTANEPAVQVVYDPQNNISNFGALHGGQTRYDDGKVPKISAPSEIRSVDPSGAAEAYPGFKFLKLEDTGSASHEKVEIVFEGIGKYIGGVRFGQLDGYGILYTPDGRSILYEGEFEENQFNGVGIMFNDSRESASEASFAGKLPTNWIRYEGLFLKNKREGFGELFFKDGSHYSGEFANDNANGFGTFVNRQGAKHAGIWRENQLVHLE